MKVITVRALVRDDDDAYDANDEFVNVLVHGCTYGGYVQVDELTDEDRTTFGPVIDDLEDEVI